MKNNYLLANPVKAVTITLLLIMATFIPDKAQAQALVQQLESFESATAGAPAIFPSPGWRQQKYVTNITAAFSIQTAATATNPACGASPGGGANVLLFNSYAGFNNDTSILITKPYDFSNNGGTNPQFSFYMYRDGGFLLNDDHIRVYINTTPSMSGATLLTNTLGSNQILRRNNAAPVAGANTWNQYTYDLAAGTYNGNRYYFIIMGVCRDGNNIYLDQVRTNTYPSAMNSTDVSFNLFLQNGASVGTNIRNHMVVGIRCIVGGTSGCGNIALGTAKKLDSLLLNTNGTTNVLDIDDAKIYYTGGSIQFDTNYVSPFPVTAGTDDYPSRRYGQIIAVPGTNLDFINGALSCFNLEYDTTYFWLAYDIKATATGGNFVDGDLRGAAVGGTAGTCPSPGGTSTPIEPSPGGFSIAGASQIDLPYCVGTYTVGTSWLSGSYTNNDYVQSVILNGVVPTLINTNVGASNNNFGLPTNLACYPNCDFTAHPPDYELWPAVSGRTVVLTQGMPYTVTVQAGTWFSSNNIAVFIDYNRDGDFLDAGEKLGQVSLNANQSQAINFNVPAAGYTGVTRMRVREVWAVSNIDPCAQYTYGEIEDFTIIISPSCPVGYKLWLGNTDDWNNPANWCGGVPTITDDAVIDANQVFPLAPVGTPTRPYYKPTIKSNILANCNNLTISAKDTLIINAPSPSTNSLKVRKDLTNNGRITVISAFNNNVTYSNGTLVNNIYTPFKSQSTDARTQIIYSQAELTLAGLINGDKITGIRFDISFKGSTAAFSGFTVSYALVPFTAHASSTPYAGPFTTVYGPLAQSTVLGTNTLTLTTPIIWDGSSNLLIQYCFDNASNVGSNDDRINITQTTGIKSTLILSSTTNAAAGCALTPIAGVTDNFFSGLGTWRPNFTFLVERPYGKALVTVQEDWINNGAFTAGYSRVIMDSTIAQTIGGTQSTTFAELQMNKGAASQTVTLLRPTLIDSSLILSQGSMLMNSQTLTMNNPAVSTGSLVAPTGPFTRTNGFLISENAAAYVIWKNVNTFGFRVIPFGSEAIATPVYIPFSYNLKGGALGDLSISTYKAVGNLPWPPGVTHFNPTSGPGNNAAAAVDRFWMVGKTGAAPVADIVFRFTTAERPVGMSTAIAANQGRAQPWRTQLQNNAWIRLVNPYTTLTYTQNYGQIGGPSDSVRVVNWDWPTLPVGPAPFFAASGPIGNLNPWTITINQTPLPVSLVKFDAEKVGNKVRLFWSTASEVNNDYFTVERADKTMDEFNFIAKVNSYMNNSNILLDYEAWDENPLQGLQYYRLKQTDFDGQYSYSEVKPIYFGDSKSFEITNVYGHTQADGQFQVEFIYDSEMPLTAIITDALGRVLYREENISATPGLNKLYLNQSLPRGMYFIILQNQESKVNRKFFY